MLAVEDGKWVLLAFFCYCLCHLRFHPSLDPFAPMAGSISWLTRACSGSTWTSRGNASSPGSCWTRTACIGRLSSTRPCWMRRNVEQRTRWGSFQRGRIGKWITWELIGGGFTVPSSAGHVLSVQYWKRACMEYATLQKLHITTLAHVWHGLCWGVKQYYPVITLLEWVSTPLSADSRWNLSEWQVSNFSQEPEERCFTESWSLLLFLWREI